MFFSKLSIKTKITASVASAIVIIGMAITLILLSKQEADKEHDLTDHTNALLDILVRNNRDNVISAGAKEGTIAEMDMETSAMQFLQQKDMLFVAVCYGAKTLIVRPAVTTTLEAGVDLESALEKLIADNAPAVLLNKDVIDKAGTPHGTYWIGVSLATIRAEINHLRTYAIVLILVMTAIAIGLSYFGTRKMFRPIGDLISFTADLGKGDFGTQMVITRNDELGTMGMALNGLSTHLAQAEKDRVEQERLRAENDRLLLKAAQEEVEKEKLLLQAAEERAETQALHQEMEAAQKIQSQFLPKGELSIPGYALACYFKPSQAVGGDGYWYALLRNGQYLIVVFDVSGHGVDSAMLMGITTATIRLAILEGETSADIIIRKVNSVLHGFIPKDAYVIMEVILYNPTDDEFTAYHCGITHTPLLVCGPQGVRDVTGEEQGLYLGRKDWSVIEGRIPCVSFTLAPSESTVITSDGTLEAQNPRGENYGTDRWIASLQRNYAADAEGLLSAVMADVNEFIGAGTPIDAATASLPMKVQDDMIVVVVKKNPKEL